MPSARTLSGESLANAIYAITDKLEEQFVEEFILQARKLSRGKSLQQLLDQIEGGYFTSIASIPSALSLIKINTSKLDAIVRKAIGSSARITNQKVGLNLSFNVRNPKIIETARNISVELSTNLSKTSQQIIDKVIANAMEGLVTRREAIKIIESRVGLLPAHSDAVDRYYDTLIQSGSTKAMAKKLADKYADRLLKYRANTIARTEIARATGIGQTEFWRQAMDEGVFSADTKRVWSTSYDELVCDICGPMNKVEVGIFEQWLTPNGFVDYPSAIHPNCRCSQGIALSASQKRMFVGKSDAEQFEHYVLSKFNPYHDELGRFTTGAGGAKAPSKKPTLSDWSEENKYDDKARQVVGEILRGGNQDERLFAVSNSDDNSKLFVEGDSQFQPTKFIRSMYEVSHGGYTSVVEKAEFYPNGYDEGEDMRRSGTLSVYIKILDSKGRKVGNASRSLEISGGNLQEVDHSLFKIDKDNQGSGFGAVFFSNSIAHYEEVGAGSVTTQANIDVGGYAWAKAGFMFQNQSDLRNAGYEASKISGMSPKGIANTFLEKMTSGNFTDADSVRTSGVLSEDMKKKIIKSLLQAEKQLKKSQEERTVFVEDLENGIHLGSRGDGDYDEDYPNGYSPKKFAEVGKKNSVKILIPVRPSNSMDYELKEVEMWVGKATMLGSDWAAILPISGEATLDYEPLP